MCMYYDNYFYVFWGLQSQSFVVGEGKTALFFSVSLLCPFSLFFFSFFFGGGGGGLLLILPYFSFTKC